MYLIREVMYCKPGKVGTLLKKFKQMEPLMKDAGAPAPRVMTDVTGEQFWTLVWEQETPSIEEYMKNMQEASKDPKMQQIMDGYHDLVEAGKREIYRIE